MFGKNAITRPVPLAYVQEHGFRLVNIFTTIQGEGPFAGRPAIFVRFAGCNLACHFCDTDFETGAFNLSAPALLGVIKELLVKHPCRLIVLTGGEPLLQPVSLLFKELQGPQWRDERGPDWQFETAGTVMPAAGITSDPELQKKVTFVVSPKTPRLAPFFRARDLSPYRRAWKYLVTAGQTTQDGIPIVDTQNPRNPTPRGVARPVGNDPVYLQPLDEQDATRNAANLIAARDLCLTTGHTLGIQLHKLIGVD